MPASDWLTPMEVAGLLRVSRSVVYRWINEGKLEAIKVGGVLRIARSELEQFSRTAVEE